MLASFVNPEFPSRDTVTKCIIIGCIHNHIAIDIVIAPSQSRDAGESSSNQRLPSAHSATLQKSDFHDAVAFSVSTVRQWAPV